MLHWTSQMVDRGLLDAFIKIFPQLQSESDEVL